MRVFSVVARKRKLSIFFIVQNIYDNSKQFRNIRLNSTGFFMFKFYAANDVNKRLLRDLDIQSLISIRQLDRIYANPFGYIFINIHPKRHSKFVTVTSNILDFNYHIHHKMDYVAVSKADFLKYFKSYPGPSNLG